MPFVEEAHRAKDHVPCCVGDWCYVYYAQMVETWQKEPRWTTAHNIYKSMQKYIFDISISDKTIAYELAWQVFFQMYVMPYEREAAKRNGSI